MMRVRRWYKLLPDHAIEPLGEPDDPMGGLLEYSQWCVENGGENAVQVARDQIRDLEVSTVFLGLDHRHFGDGPPLVFETAVISQHGTESVMRASTWDEALEKHQMALSLRDRSIKGPWIK